MFIELVDALRCVEPHEDSWLVLATRRMDGRTVVEGTLGCPVCRRSYTITGGVAYLGTAPGESPSEDPAARGAAPTEDDTMRLAALLDLTSPGGLVVLGGGWARHADAILDLAPVRLLLLDPTVPVARDDRLAPDGSVSVLRTGGGVVPLAAGAARAVALDDATVSDARLAAAARALAPGGRLVAPVGVGLPAHVRELARDGELWVAERERDGGASGGGAPVALRRARRE
ncbi:MAG TPA: hypothetical protein VNS52_12925 [Gemmatimonadaceae bacterium]|nr:hypothetical protein [Gemmatimonadaceae bacterium]